MDRDLEELPRAIVEKEPQGDLDDKARENMAFAMLALSPTEKYEALWKFANTVTNELTRPISNDTRRGAAL